MDGLGGIQNNAGMTGLSDASGTGHFQTFTGDVDSKTNYIVFMIGGITPAEVRDLELLAHRRGVRIIVGGTQLLTPKRFINKFLRDPETEVAEEAANAPRRIKPSKGDSSSSKNTKKQKSKIQLW